MKNTRLHVRPALGAVLAARLTGLQLDALCRELDAAGFLLVFGQVLRRPSDSAPSCRLRCGSRCSDQRGSVLRRNRRDTVDSLVDFRFESTLHSNRFGGSGAPPATADRRDPHLLAPSRLSVEVVSGVRR
jgi:hypothetical protein